MDAWVDRVREALGGPEEVDVVALLRTARDVAHRVERRAAPVTTYVVGAAVGRGVPLPEAIATVDALLREPT